MIAELHQVSAVLDFDVLLLRDVDVEDIRRDLPGRLAYGDDPNDISSILALDANVDVIAEWLKGVFHTASIKGLRIPALATYVPDVTSIDQDRRERAIKALQNVVLIGYALKSARLMNKVIVEIVCGSTADRCCGGTCSLCRVAQSPRRVFKSTVEAKLDVLCKSLSEAVSGVRKRHSVTPGQFAYALELEPGDVYVLRDFEGLKRVRDLIVGRTDADQRGPLQPRYPSLAPCVGFNLDVAHFKIEGSDPAQLDEFRDLLVHAHISDHPGMHTRDQPVGSWTPVQYRNGAYRPYMELLNERMATECPLPFSGAIAIELEGCNRLSWIHNSVSALKHLIYTT